MKSSWIPIIALMPLLAWPAWSADSQSADDASGYAGLQGKLLLDNPRVLVHQIIIAPGQSTGRRTSRAEQLLVFIKGGVMRSDASGRSSLWKDGRVLWLPAAGPADEGSTNAGTTPIMIDLVTLKPTAASAASPTADGRPKYRHLDYPNIPGEDILENESVIVQRFTVNPGQWEGVHAHHPDMLYIHVKGGQWAARSNSEREHAYPQASPDGSVGWMKTIGIGEGHESGNIGKDPIDLIWVTLKK